MDEEVVAEGARNLSRPKLLALTARLAHPRADERVCTQPIQRDESVAAFKTRLAHHRGRYDDVSRVPRDRRRKYEGALGLHSSRFLAWHCDIGVPITQRGDHRSQPDPKSRSRNR